MPPTAERGQIWMIDLGLAAKPRPALVLSVGYLDHERAVITYVPRTLSLRGTRFEVAHQAPGFEPGVFDAQGIGGIPPVRLIRRMSMIDAATLTKVEGTVKDWLGLA